MPRERSDLHSNTVDTAPTLLSRVLVTARGWRREDAVERAACDILRACGPLTEPGARGLPVYLGFPWSAYIDSLRNPEALDALLLRSAWRALRASVPAGAKVVTVCTHPLLPEYLDGLTAAGVTDLFWTGTMPGLTSLPNAPDLRLHPFPALPGPGSAAVTAIGPEAAFAMCPEAGNTPDLWAALAAGLIPVLSLDGPQLPGASALWQAAAVVHDGSEAALAALPAQLSAIAANPSRMAAMRRGLSGIGLLYGHGRMVHDVLVCLIERVDPAQRAQSVAEPADGQSLFAPLIRRFYGHARLSAAEAHLVMQQAGCDLLIGNGGELTLAPGPRSAAAWRLIGLARMALDKNSLALAQFDETLALLRDRDLLPTRISTAGTTTRRAARQAAPLRIHLLGPRGQRTPLAYAPLRHHLGGRVDFVDRAEKADLVVTGWSRDLEDNRAELAALWQSGVRPGLMVLSEEPLWDSLWSGDLSPRNRVLDCGGGIELPYLSLNHTNSSIFRFETLPWFILSDNRFLARYALLMTPFAALSPRALLRHWHATPLQAAFMAEHRQTPDFAASFPVEGVMGLSLYRSRVAELTPGDRVLRIGQGWPGTDMRRQDLPDWHLDKLARLYGQARLCGAYENTLQSSYITEKPFDAFAVGAIPVTVADIGHQLFDLIQPEAMLNTRFCAPDVAAARIASFVPDLTVAEAWIETAQGLLARLRDPALIRAEYQRLAESCLAELLGFAQSVNSA